MTKFKKEHMILLESIDSKVQILMELVIACAHKIDAMSIGGSEKKLKLRM